MKSLSEMTGPELVAEYNKLAALLGQPTTKRFGDRKSGIRRIEALQAQVPEEPEDEPKEKTPWGAQKANRHHRLHNKENRVTKKPWTIFLDAIQEEADEDSGVIDVEAVKARFPGITSQIFGGFFAMAYRFELIDKDPKTKDWIINQ